MRISIDVGAVFPLRAGALGKVLMRSLPLSAVVRYFSFYAKRYSDNTIMSYDETEVQLQEIRQRIYTKGGQIIAAISVPYPTVSSAMINQALLAQQIIATRAKVSVAYANHKHFVVLARMIYEGV